VAADDSFGIALYRVLAAERSGNLAISPLSVAEALQMLYPGARGSTAAQFAEVLHLPAPDSSSPWSVRWPPGSRRSPVQHVIEIRDACGMWKPHGA